VFRTQTGGMVEHSTVLHALHHALDACGLPRIRVHDLRHTAATAMLHAGGSLTEIGQVLRHRRVLTTAIYAKVDQQALRLVARPWPGDAV